MMLRCANASDQRMYEAGGGTGRAPTLTTRMLSEWVAAERYQIHRRNVVTDLRQAHDIILSEILEEQSFVDVYHERKLCW